MRKIGFVGVAALVAFTGARGFLALHAQAPAQSAQIPNLAFSWFAVLYFGRMLPFLGGAF